MQRMDAACESERRFSETVLVLLTGQPNYYCTAIVIYVVVALYTTIQLVCIEGPIVQ